MIDKYIFNILSLIDYNNEFCINLVNNNSNYIFDINKLNLIYLINNKKQNINTILDKLNDDNKIIQLYIKKIKYKFLKNDIIEFNLNMINDNIKALIDYYTNLINKK